MSSISVTVSARMMIGLEEVCKDYAHELLKSVSDRRGMSLENLLEGVDFPRLERVEKVVKEKVVKEKVVKKSVDLPKVVLPFLGILDDCCKGVIRNHNLYTQCVGIPKSGDLCNKCVKSQEKGKFLGLITSRVVGEIVFKTANDKDAKISPYVDVCGKLNISKDEAVAEASRFGWTLSDDYFEEKEKVRGRPKKSAKDTTVEENGEGKKRGRPKKDKKVVSNVENGDNLIAKLVAEISNDDKSSSPSAEDDDEVPVDAPKVVAVSVAPKKVDKEAEKAAKKAAKEAEKEAKKAAKDAEKAAKEAEKAAKEAEKEAKKAKKMEKEPKATKKVATPSPPPVESEDISEEEEAPKVVTVKKFEFGGKRYKLSSENILYDWETDEPVGIWNADKKCIEEYENSSEEDEDEE